MRPSDLYKPITSCARLWLVLLLLLPGLTASASDLPAVSDGEHLWLVEPAQPKQTEGEEPTPRLTIHHLHADAKPGQATKLDPIAGELMPGGLTAGDGRLLMVMADRQVQTLRPVWSELMRQWTYPLRTLPELPQGCALRSLAMSDRGPWALVYVESDELLAKLDQAGQAKEDVSNWRMLNHALGLPAELQWNAPSADPEQTPDEDEAAPAEGEDESAVDADEKPKLQAPAYRLIHLHGSRWISSPLPEGFSAPREVAIIMRPGDIRPSLIVETMGDLTRSSPLLRYLPVAPVEPDAEGDTPAKPAWTKVYTTSRHRPGRLWATTMVKGQAVLVVERYRPRTSVTVDTYLMRGTDSVPLGTIILPTGEDARWTALPWKGDIGLVASPGPKPTEPVPEGTPATAALLSAQTLSGDAVVIHEETGNPIVSIYEKQLSSMDGNADLLIQIIAFVFAMTAMVMFYQRAPRQQQVDLPDHLALASFSRRALSGMIDLAPGFWLASLIYGVTFNDIILYNWPGNGVEKVFGAMRPGFVVIGVTLVHTTIMEFIFARSIGKFLTGLYVADLKGKPAPPAPSFGRAISRVFELFAPLLIIIAVISPARQRLGDILAKTTVVMAKPREPGEQEGDDDRE